MSDDRDIFERLDQLLALKVGDPFSSDWDSNNWGPKMSALLQDARDEIVRLRNQRFLNALS